VVRDDQRRFGGSGYFTGERQADVRNSQESPRPARNRLCAPFFIDMRKHKSFDAKPQSDMARETDKTHKCSQSCGSGTLKKFRLPASEGEIVRAGLSE
jgi:hypothetical protein